jgi:hypothetical protein
MLANSEFELFVAVNGEKISGVPRMPSDLFFLVYLVLWTFGSYRLAPVARIFLPGGCVLPWENLS